MLQRSLSLFSSPKYTARQGAMWTAAFHLVMLSWQWINPAFGGPLEASFHLCILQRPNGFFESFFFFPIFIFGWEKTTRKTDIKVSVDAPSACTYVQACTLGQHWLSAQSVCHPSEPMHCSL